MIHDDSKKIDFFHGIFWRFRKRPYLCTVFERERTTAKSNKKGRLAQLVQSVCLTSRGSGVRIPQRPPIKTGENKNVFSCFSLFTKQQKRFSISSSSCLCFFPSRRKIISRSKEDDGVLSMIFPTSCSYVVFDAVALAVLIMYVLGFPKKIYFCGPILLTYLSRD